MTAPYCREMWDECTVLHAWDDCTVLQRSIVLWASDDYQHTVYKDKPITSSVLLCILCYSSFLSAQQVVASPCSSAPPPLPPLDQFSLDRVLFEDPKAKSIAVAGQFAGSADTAVIIAEKSPLSSASLSELFCPRSKTSTNFQNNIYSQIEASCGGSVGDLRLMTVYPATEAHVTKYSQQTIHIIHETPEDYATITKPFIESQSFDIQVYMTYNIMLLTTYNVN